MDIERLKELKEQIRGSRDGINGDDLNLLYDLLPLVDAAIARQSAEDKNVPTSEEVAGAIEDLTTLSKMWKEIGQPTKEIDLAIAALQAYEPTTRKDRIVEEVAISKTETTSCKWCKSFDRFEFNPIDHDGNCIPDEYCMVQSGLAAYCPNCGRKIKEEQP